jgi:hypothetical protein
MRWVHAQRSRLIGFYTQLMHAPPPLHTHRVLANPTVLFNMGAYDTASV